MATANKTVQPNNTLSSALTEANQTMYSYNYPYTPFQPQGLHTTLACVQSSAPSPPFIQPSPSPQINLVERIDERLNRFMQDVDQTLSKLDILDELSQRLVRL